MRNEPTVRLDDFRLSDKTAYFYTSRSTFLNHMVTNRAMDYPIAYPASVRSLYEYKKRLSPLLESKMSNHIGINALVYLSDGTFLMPFWGGNATISKRLVSAGIAMRLIVDDCDKEITPADIFEKPITRALERSFISQRKNRKRRFAFSVSAAISARAGNRSFISSSASIITRARNTARCIKRRRRSSRTRSILTGISFSVGGLRRSKGLRLSSKSFLTNFSVPGRLRLRRNRHSSLIITCIKTANSTGRKKRKARLKSAASTNNAGREARRSFLFLC